MAIRNVGPVVAYRGDEQQQQGSFITPIITTAATAGTGAMAGGYLFKEKVTPERLANMSADTFTRISKGVPTQKHQTLVEEITRKLTLLHPDNMTLGMQNIVDSLRVSPILQEKFGGDIGIEDFDKLMDPKATETLTKKVEDARAALKKTPEDVKAKEGLAAAEEELATHTRLAEKYKGADFKEISKLIETARNTKTISVDEFLNTFTEPETPEKKVTAATLNEEFEQGTSKTKKLETALKNAEEALGKTPDDAAAKQAVEEARTALSTHVEEFRPLSNVKAVIDTAKESGQINIETINEYVKKDRIAELGKQLKGFGEDVPKAFSGKKALIGAAIGTIVAGVGYLLFGGKKNEA